MSANNSKQEKITKIETERSDRTHKEPRTSSEESVTKEVREETGLIERLATVLLISSFSRTIVSEGFDSDE